LDSRWKFRNSKNNLAGAGTQTAEGLGFGGYAATAITNQLQKNIMEQVGQQVEILITARS
jgi:hypothetical protein